MKTDKPLLIRNLRVDLEDRDRDPAELAASRLGINRDRVSGARVVRRSLDARRGRPGFILAIRARVAGPPGSLPAGVTLAPEESPLDPPRPVPGDPQVVVVGCGPAGLFAALRLARAGIRPVIVDRGRELASRGRDVATLLRDGKLEPESNFHFGLGGAGTYSDGKLFTRLHHPGVHHVLVQFARFGAGPPEEILVDAQPHVGTDRWPVALDNFTAELVRLGCRFRFRSRVTGLETRRSHLTGLRLADGKLECQAAILAPGNSARDLFEVLGAEAPLVAKPFAVGVRLTHPQELIDRIQYKKSAGHPALPPASYRLSARVRGRGVYTFCMCPGGSVVPTPTEPERLALNGMSHSARSSGEANAAVVVTLSPEDLGPGPLAGVAFQRQLERSAYRGGGGDYHAPAQPLGDFLAGRPPAATPACNYRPGVTPADLAPWLPPFLLDPLRSGLAEFCRRMKGLDHPRAAVLGFETRTSSPVRILRNPDGMSPEVAGLFPAGEGSGYAGGIVSSAVDGIRAADHMIDWLLA